MIVDCVTFWLPKQGNAPEEYEDAFSHNTFVPKPVETFRCAVADGATEASFSQAWAKILTKGYVEGFDLPKLQEAWRMQTTQQPLAWYAEEKAQMGAFAALVGLTIHSNKHWECRAIGDSCLIQVRNSKIIFTFPLGKAEQFSDTPFLLSSNEQNNQKIEEYWQTSDGLWKRHDVFLLLTDALAHWLFKQHEQSIDALSVLLALTEQESFSNFVDKARNQTDPAKHMKNDDVTMLRAKVASAGK